MWCKIVKLVLESVFKAVNQALRYRFLVRNDLPRIQTSSKLTHDNSSH
jgi:hypothetical protein